MAQLYNPGAEIIDAYLKGKHIQDQSIQAEREMQARIVAQQQNQQKIDEEIKQFNSRLNQEKDIAHAKLDVDKKTLELRTKALGYQALQAIRGSGAQGPDGQPLNVGNILTGDPTYFSGLTLPTQAEINERDVKKAVDIAGKSAEATQPYKKELLQVGGDIKSQSELAHQNFLSSEWKKNRDATRQNKLDELANRIQVAEMRKGGAAEARAEEKKALKNEAIDAYKPDIFDGTVTLEEIPKGDAGLAINTAIRGEKIKILNNKDREKLLGLKSLENFHKKVAALNTLLQNSNGVFDAATSGEIKRLSEGLEADLTIFGREAKAEKGVVTDKDIDRLRGAIPKVLPGGMASLFDKKGRNKTNEQRTRDIENIYFDKAEVLLKGMSPAQRSAVEKRFEIMPRLERVE